MAKKKITVKGATITVIDDNFVSLTDIAKQNSDTESYFLIRSWLRNNNTLIYLNEWEKLHNPNFKPSQMRRFRDYAAENRNSVTPSKYIKETDSIGLVYKAGKYGGTFAHSDIAVNFCYWLSPAFQVYLVKEFQRLKEEEFQMKNLKWHISKITDNIEMVRNLLDTIPHQEEVRRRIKKDISIKKNQKK